MTAENTAIALIDIIRELQVTLEKAVTLVNDLNNNYFSKGREECQEFDTYRIKSEIAGDYLFFHSKELQEFAEQVESLPSKEAFTSRPL